MVGPTPYNLNVPVTPDDSVNFPQWTTQKVPTSAIYVGTTGDVVTIGVDGTAVTWKAVPAGTFLKIAVIRVNSTNTSASNLVACYWI